MLAASHRDFCGVKGAGPPMGGPGSVANVTAAKARAWSMVKLSSNNHITRAAALKEPRPL